MIEIVCGVSRSGWVYFGDEDSGRALTVTVVETMSSRKVAAVGPLSS